MPREKQDQDLFESERSFRLLVENVADYALYMLDTAGVITSWNVGGQRIKGYLPEEIIGQHFSRFYTESDRAKDRPSRALRIARETGKYEEEGWRVRKDGTFFWASVVIDPIYEDKRLVGFAKITRDITERRENQQKLERIQKQLAESQKLDALGQLTGGIAHDFNNLLMVIGGSNQILKRIVGEDAKAARAVQAIETASTRGAALTRQLLTFARRQSVNPQSVHLRAQFDAIRDVLDAGVGKAVHLDVQLPEDVWPVKVDVTEFETALVNLAINGRDAMPRGGTLSISAENVVLNDDAHDGDFVSLRVTDTGEGIPQDIVEKVFDPFFTTKEIGKGTGLGLSQVHGFAYQAGGFVELESVLGTGTSVKIFLPRTVSIEKNLADGQTSAVASGVVLLVEDNPDVASATTGLLEQLGYSVKWASSADAALSELEKNNVDIVFSDIVMPGMDGLALARIIRSNNPTMPILLATGYSDALQTAPSDFPVLKKPYQIHELSQALAKLSA